MFDIPTLAAALTAVKTATDIAKGLKSSTTSLKDAETKYAIAELTIALADANINMAETIEIIREKDDQIKRLEDAMKLSVDLIRYRDAYYELVDGKPNGAPFCSMCWEVEHTAIHLIKSPQRSTYCPKCKSAYDKFNTPVLTPKQEPTTIPEGSEHTKA
jgi:hypothetical protein